LSLCPPGKRAHWLTRATSIFFQTANTKRFDSAEEQHAFFMRWFGNYAETQAEAFIFALHPDGDVCGYAAGCVDSFAAASKIIVDAIPYFTLSFCRALAEYPSHFHINVKPGLQGKGVGRLLTSHFVQLCADASSPGIHVVTGASSPAVKFYEACDFRRLSPGDGIGFQHTVLVRRTGAPSKEQIRT
jgi:GNAT superfamily N-acetyltransferase